MASNTSSFHNYEPYNCTSYDYALLSYFRRLSVHIFILGSLGFLSNFLFLVTVVKHPELRRNRLRILLAILSVIDTMLSLFNVSLSVTWLMASLRNTINVSLHFFLSFRYPLQLTSCVIVTIISVERYKSIRDPFKQMRSSTGLNPFSCLVGVVCILVCVWTLVSVCQCYFLAGNIGNIIWCVMSNNEFMTAVVYSSHSSSVFMVLTLVKFILVPSEVITIVISVSMCTLTYRMLRRLPNVADESQRRHLKAQRNLTKMVIVNTAVFCVCVLLADVTVLMMSHYIISYETMFSYVTVVSSLNSMLNPIIYNAFGSAYRQAFLKTYPCLKIILRGWADRGPRGDHGIALTNMT